MSLLFGRINIKSELRLEGCDVPSRGEHVAQTLSRVSSSRLDAGVWHSVEICPSQVLYVSESEQLGCICDTELGNVNSLLADARNDGIELGQCSTAAAIAHLVRKRGYAAFLSLAGAFACVVWDRGQIWLAADRFGMKRLCFSIAPDNVAFSSRPGWLGKGKPLNENAVYQYMSFAFVPTPETIFKGVQKLACGDYLHWDGRAWNGGSIGELDYPENASGSEDQLAGALKQSLQDAVAATTSGLEPATTGCYLSGGTDSSTVLGMAREVWGSAPAAFSIGFEDEAFSELYYARIAARRFEARHYEYIVTADDGWRALPNLVQGFEEPFGNPSAIGGYICAELAASHGIRTMLAGDGGDEIFGGNERYAKDVVFKRCHPMAKVLVNNPAFELLSRISSRSATSVRIHNILKRAALNNPERFYLEDCLSASLNSDVLSPDVGAIALENEPLEIVRRYFHSARANSELNRLLFVDMKLTIGDNDLVKVRETAAACGVRVRFPMLDSALVTFSGAMPASLKVKGLEKRYLFKRALREFLPQEIIRKTKHGFGVPVSIWMRSDPRFRHLVMDTLGGGETAQRGLFRIERLKQMLDEHMRGFRDWGQLLWAALMLELSIRESSNG